MMSAVPVSKFRAGRKKLFFCLPALAVILSGLLPVQALSIWHPRIKEMRAVDVTFEEAVECLRIRSQIDDIFERDPSKKGVNLVIMDLTHAIDASRRASWEIHDMKVDDVVKIMAAVYNVRLRVEPYAYVFTAKSDPGPMMTRYISVPPNFSRMKSSLK